MSWDQDQHGKKADGLQTGSVKDGKIQARALSGVLMQDLVRNADLLTDPLKA